MRKSPLVLAGELLASRREFVEAEAGNCAAFWGRPKTLVAKLLPAEATRKGGGISRSSDIILSNTNMFSV